MLNASLIGVCIGQRTNWNGWAGNKLGNKKEDVTKDVKRLADIQYNLGYLSGLAEKDRDDDLASDLAIMISDYIIELFNAKSEITMCIDVKAGGGEQLCKLQHQTKSQSETPNKTL